MKPFEFTVVRHYDPEVLRHKSIGEATDYQINRDLEKLALPSEARPITFKCRSMTRRERRDARRLTVPEDRYEMAFRFGVLEVSNLPGEDGTLRNPTIVRKDGEPLSDENLDALGLGDIDVYDIGSVIWAHSFLGKGMPLTCERLPTSREACIAWVAHHAAQREASSMTEVESSES